jgi:hypothetical protein
VIAGIVIVILLVLFGSGVVILVIIIVKRRRIQKKREEIYLRLQQIQQNQNVNNQNREGICLNTRQVMFYYLWSVLWEFHIFIRTSAFF